VALVTGASAGLGAAMAIALAEAGADVAVHGNSRSPANTAARIEAIGRRAMSVTGDLGDRAVSAAWSATSCRTSAASTSSSTTPV